MSGILPSWLERALGIQSASGEGTLWRLESTWTWAPWVTLLAVLSTAGLIVLLYAQQRGGLSRGRVALLAGLRLGLLGLVLLMLAELVLSLQRTGLPYVVVVVDDSASMEIVDRYESSQRRAAIESRLQALELPDASRANLARSLLLQHDGRLLDELAQRYKLKLYFASSAAREQPGGLEQWKTAIRELEPTGKESRLGTAIRQILGDLRGTPPAAVVVATDGLTTDGETLAQVAGYARRKGVPLYLIGLGSQQPVRDLELSDLLVDDVVFVDDVINFQCLMTASGYEGEAVELVLREEGRSAILGRTSVKAGPDGEPQTVQLQYRPQSEGRFRYVVEIEPRDDEEDKTNNRQARVVEVRKQQVRVLLVQAYPNYEYRYLKNLLERDNTVEVQVLLQEADVEYAQFDRSALRVFPVRREELFQYDVVIFGDVNPRFLSRRDLTNLRDFVQEKGGGVILAAGPRYMPTAYIDSPLETLLPVDPESVVLPPDTVLAEGFSVSPTDLGRMNPNMQLGDSPEQNNQIWNSLPELYWLAESADLKPAVRVLAEHPTRRGRDGRPLPVFCLHFVGAGKVLYHATDETWRWRFRVGDVLFARYWIQSIRYLARSTLLSSERGAELTVDRKRYRLGEPIRVRVRFVDERLAPAADDGVTVVVERKGSQRRIHLDRTAAVRGVFEGTLTATAVGNYHVWMAAPALQGTAPAADFEVEAPPGEFERVELDVAELARAAKRSHGAFYQFPAGTLLDDLPAGRQVPVQTLPPQSLWNRWWVLALFLSLLVSEWVLRKRSGLL